MRDRAFQRNAAEPDQVHFAQSKVKRVAAHRFDVLRGQLSSYGGREFVWQELERHGIHDLLTGPSEQLYERLGRRNAGVELLIDVMRDHHDAYLLMHTEAVMRLKRANQELDAAQTPVTHEGTLTQESTI